MKSIRIATLAGAVALAISGASMAQSVAPAGAAAGARAAGTSAGTTAAVGVNSGTPGVGAPAATATGTNGNATNGNATTGNTTTGNTSTGNTSGNASGNSTSGTSGNTDPATTRPGSFEPGGAFGTSGTTSGTAGSTTSGAGVTQQQVDANGNPVTGVQVVPGTGSVVTDGTTQAGSQQNVLIQQPAAPAAATRTPLLDEAARKVQARDAQRKATGDSPRVEAIAPRTNRDLTKQMPDDPVIRY